jgi:hypothetical protein
LYEEDLKKIYKDYLLTSKDAKVLTDKNNKEISLDIKN